MFFFKQTLSLQIDFFFFSPRWIKKKNKKNTTSLPEAASFISFPFDFEPV